MAERDRELEQRADGCDDGSVGEQEWPLALLFALLLALFIALVVTTTTSAASAFASASAAIAVVHIFFARGRRLSRSCVELT